MRWEDFRRSDNVEDRRGQGGFGGGRLPGGCGGLGIGGLIVVALIAWATGLIPEPAAMKPSELLPLWSPEHIAQEAIALPAHWMDLLR